MKKIPNEFWLLAVRAAYAEAFDMSAKGRQIGEIRIRIVDGRLQATIRADLPGSIDAVTLECATSAENQLGPARVPAGQSPDEEGFKA